MDKICIHNIRLYAYHGCLEEEAIIGSDYRVDVEVSADLSKASTSDELKDTVDYVHLHEIVRKEMGIRSKLLEHVAKRIIDRIFAEATLVKEATVSVSKINPPIGGDVASVKVSLTKNRT